MTPQGLSTAEVSSRAEVDRELGDRFQKFSAELLRVATALIGGLVALAQVANWANAKSPEQWGSTVLTAATFAFLATAGACALLHRYFATDALAHLVKIDRLGGAAGDAREEQRLLHIDLKLSGYLLGVSVVCLGAGFLGAAQLAVLLALGAAWIPVASVTAILASIVALWGLSVKAEASREWLARHDKVKARDSGARSLAER